MSKSIDASTVRELLEGCYEAKRITETLPRLPDGIKPKHTHVLHSIDIICTENKVCRVSDVSTHLHTTMPSITKLINELYKMNLLEKYADPTDKRSVLLKLTPSGKTFVKRYVLDFHDEWASNMKDISIEQVNEAIQVISYFKKAMPTIIKEEEDMNG